MSPRDPLGTWLPSSRQITMAPERRAEHPTLDEERSRDLKAEPPPPHLALAGSIVTLAETLHELITGYSVMLERALGDAENDDIS